MWDRWKALRTMCFILSPAFLAWLEEFKTSLNVMFEPKCIEVSDEMGAQLISRSHFNQSNYDLKTIIQLSLIHVHTSGKSNSSQKMLTSNLEPVKCWVRGWLAFPGLVELVPRSSWSQIGNSRDYLVLSGWAHCNHKVFKRERERQKQGQVTLWEEDSTITGASKVEEKWEHEPRDAGSSRSWTVERLDSPVRFQWTQSCHHPDFSPWDDVEFLTYRIA